MKMDGVVLAGGKSSRFGQDKAFADYQGQFFYQHMINVMYRNVQHIYMVKREDQLMGVDDRKVTLLTDDPTFKGNGPLAGIYTAMQYSEAEWFLVLPIDTPLIETSVFFKLKQFSDSRVDAVVPRINDRIHPLIALYHRNTKQRIEEQLLQGKRSMRQLLDNVRVSYVDYNEKAEYLFANINTRKAYRKFIAGETE